MSYTESDKKADNTDWELLESLARQYGKTYHQLSKKQRIKVDNTYTETVEQYDFEFYGINYPYYK